jgi:hypothetical protein
VRVKTISQSRLHDQEHWQNILCRAVIHWRVAGGIHSNSDQRSIKTHSDRWVILLIDRHVSRVTPRVMDDADAQKIIVFKPSVQSSHISRRLDLSVFEIFSMVYKCEPKTKQMKRKERLSKIIALFCHFTKRRYFQWSDEISSRLDFTSVQKISLVHWFAFRQKFLTELWSLKSALRTMSSQVLLNPVCQLEDQDIGEPQFQDLQNSPSVRRRRWTKWQILIPCVGTSRWKTNMKRRKLTNSVKVSIVV